ncbi:MAG: hypothetical protein LBR10_01915 [Prevotellaceae bacterium]|jgi:hypothetical protein|nr:hypothetical protein [Prevotellaceae bacterium]
MEEQDKQFEDYIKTSLKEREKLETYTVEQLEAMILSRWNASETVDDELEDYLSARKRKINDAFEWTPDNIEKLLRLNQKLIGCFEKLRDEAKSIVKTFQKRIKEKDEFLHDFDIEARITPYIYVPDENGNLNEAELGMERILTDSLNEYTVLYHWYDVEGENIGDMLYLDKEQNWNDDPQFEGKFDGHFISQSIHDLYDHTCWSFLDILKINHLWADLRVVHQHFEDI